MTSPLAFTPALFSPLNLPQEIYDISLVNHPLHYEQFNISSYAYKKVANQTYPISTTLPENFHIVCHIPSDPLENMPTLPFHSPDFILGTRYTQERKEAMKVNEESFLTDEEEKLVHHLIKLQEMAFAWNEDEKGRFLESILIQSPSPPSSTSLGSATTSLYHLATVRKSSTLSSPRSLLEFTSHQICHIGHAGLASSRKMESPFSLSMTSNPSMLSLSRMLVFRPWSNSTQSHLEEEAVMVYLISLLVLINILSLQNPVTLPPSNPQSALFTSHQSQWAIPTRCKYNRPTLLISCNQKSLTSPCPLLMISLSKAL
jgi:hypothetical protein